ncbi:MarR family winged helix-turn-helix transcriptional regulator [Streptomyces sp. KMM 9044]|uniref:MarR family winged helix-turn-helix transcriptional regulator n=1 Tax=Streptomyces sp. KMM 9044 TaxID=2744474 RepID=UPI002151CD5E|nr:MarR family transcriptional regulator [Streptomyces sp. KMM 9044]WAX81236.1 MarR family transcriptional regulator [Streptomyces sp. KMM 9044]
MDNTAPAGHVIPLTRLAQKAARLAQVVNAATRHAASDAGLTTADADVLLTLFGTPDHRLRPTSLSTTCGLSSGGTSNVILRLAQAGYVNREADVHDGRSTWVQLTSEGEALARSVLAAATAEHSRLHDRLPDDTAAALEQLLDTALHHLEGQDTRPAGAPLP